MNEAKQCLHHIRNGRNLAFSQGVTIDDLPAAPSADDSDSFEIQKPVSGSQKLTFAQIKAALITGACTCSAISNADIDALF